MKKIWQDVHLSKYLSSLFFILFFSFLFWTGFRDYYQIKTYQIVIVSLVFLFALYYFISMWTPKPTYVAVGGIRIGDIPNDGYELNIFKFKRESTFLSWSQIKNVNIINKSVKHNFLLVLKPFLVVRSKDGRKYQTFIANPKGFVKALKELKKDKLLVANASFKVKK
jgi:hypothetical protein